MKKIILIGPLPPPYYGQSVGFQSFYEKIKNNFKCYLINIQPKYTKPGIGWKWTRAYEYIFLIMMFLYYLFKTNKNCIIYITVGQSQASFVRDMFFFLLSFIFKRKVYAHLKGGNFKNFYDKSNSVIKKLIIFFYKRVHTIIILGPSLKDNFSFCEKIKNKVVIVENGLAENIDTKQIETNKKSNNKKNKLKILFLSNLIQSKGYLDLLEALRILEKYTLNFSCVFAGNVYLSPDDPKKTNEKQLTSSFKNSINTLKNRKNIKFLGPVFEKEKVKLLEQADVFVLPTYYVNEGQPVSIIEAMAYKNAIISTPYRSIVDLITNKKEGFLISPKSPKEIANSLLALNSDRNLLVKMQNESFITYSNRFTKEKHLAKLFKALNL